MTLIMTIHLLMINSASTLVFPIAGHWTQAGHNTSGIQSHYSLLGVDIAQESLKLSQARKN